LFTHIYQLPLFIYKYSYFFRAFILFIVNLRKSSSLSIPINCLFNIEATTPVVPEPLKGSKITAFSFVEDEIILFSNSIGF